MVRMERQPLRATLTRRVEWADVDAAGRLHHSFIFRLVESAELRLMEASGILREFSTSAPRVHHEVNYLGALHAGQDATASISLDRLGRASVTYSFEVWAEPFGGRPRSLVATGVVVAAHVAQGDNHATPWPDSIQRALSSPPLDESEPGPG